MNLTAEQREALLEVKGTPEAEMFLMRELEELNQLRSALPVIKELMEAKDLEYDVFHIVPRLRTLLACNLKEED